MCQCELGPGSEIKLFSDFPTSQALRFHGDDCSIFMIEFENQNFGEFVDPTATDATAATTAATV